MANDIYNIDNGYALNMSGSYEERISPLDSHLLDLILNTEDEQRLDYLVSAYRAIRNRMNYTLDNLELQPEYVGVKLSARINSINYDKNTAGKEVVRFSVMYYQCFRGDAKFINTNSGRVYELDLGTGILKNSQGEIETGARL